MSNFFRISYWIAGRIADKKYKKREIDLDLLVDKYSVENFGNNNFDIKVGVFGAWIEIEDFNIIDKCVISLKGEDLSENVDGNLENFENLEIKDFQTELEDNKNNLNLKLLEDSNDIPEKNNDNNNSNINIVSNPNFESYSIEEKI